MSIKLMTKAWDTDQKGNDLLVLLAMCDFANDEGILFPSLKTIAKKAKVSKTTLSYILRAYEAIGVITRTQRKRENGSDTSTIYKINSLDFDSESFKKEYQKSRNYTSTSSQCEHPKTTENDKIVNTQSHNVNTQNANCEHLEPSILNHHSINPQLKKGGIKVFDIISFYKNNISNLESKIKEIKATSSLALIPDSFDEVMLGLANYAKDLPKDAFKIKNLHNFIQDRTYKDYQTATSINKPTNTFAIKGKVYEEEEF